MSKTNLWKIQGHHAKKQNKQKTTKNNLEILGNSFRTYSEVSFLMNFWIKERVLLCTGVSKDNRKPSLFRTQIRDNHW